jgi:hypothetical protein
LAIENTHRAILGVAIESFLKESAYRHVRRFMGASPFHRLLLPKKEGSRLSTRGKLPSGFDAAVLDQTTLGKRNDALSPDQKMIENFDVDHCQGGFL